MLEYIYVCRHGFRWVRLQNMLTCSSNWQPDGWSKAPTDLIRDHPVSAHQPRLFDAVHSVALSLRTGSAPTQCSLLCMSCLGAGSAVSKISLQQLAAHGLTQSDDLAEFLTTPREYPVPEKIVASPWYRCVQTAAPLARKLGQQIHLDHGPAEWYAPAAPGTGLHPRPIMGGPATMSQFFDPGLINEDYTSTLYPSRRGESLQEIHDRLDLFAKTFVRRMDAEGVRSVVIFAHAATVIALGRAVSHHVQREVDIRLTLHF